MNHITTIDELSIGEAEPIRGCASLRTATITPLLDESTVPTKRPVTLYVWTCSCGEACGYYVRRAHAELGALTHRLG